MRPFGIYITILLSVLILATVGINYFANPYSYFNANYEDGYDLTGYWRLVKPKWVLQEDYNAYIIGSSRSQSGFDPLIVDSLLGEDTKTYNMGLPGMGYHEALETTKYILSNTDTSGKITFVLALDAYLMPMNKAKARNEFTTWTPKRNNAFGKVESSIDFYAKVLLSKAALTDSYDKLTSKKKPQLSWQKNGFSRVGYSKYKPNNIPRDIKKWKKRKRFILGDRKLEYLDNTLALLDRPNIEVYLILPPIHNIVQGVFEELSPGYQNKVKTKLAQTIMPYIKAGANLHFYDFLICNEYNSEIFVKKHSENFRDLSHMRATYGDEMLEIALTHKKNSDLGYSVTSMDKYKRFIKRDYVCLTEWLDKTGDWTTFSTKDNKNKNQEEEADLEELDEDFIE